MRSSEVEQSSGVDLIEAMLAIFGEVTAAMNQCMQIQLQPSQNFTTPLLLPTASGVPSWP